MAARVVLHVGLMKSGTSYLQRRLFAGRDALRADGVLVPGEQWRHQVLAAADVLERVDPPDAAGAWAWFLDEVARASGPVVMSMEFLAAARPERIARILEDLAVPVDVIVTLRDLGRNVPAMWQETLQNGGSVPWAEYAGRLRGGESWARAFWRQQGMGRIVDNWVAGAGADAVTMITVPPPGADPELLWERFCEAARIDGAAALPVDPANTSLDAAAARVLRDLNASLEGDELSHADYQRVVKHELAKQRLAKRSGPEAPRIGFEPPPWVYRRTDQIRERLRASGARVVGDLAELDPVTTPGVDPGTLADAAVKDAAVDALRRMVLLRAEREPEAARG